jgi:hypothetical protein
VKRPVLVCALAAVLALGAVAACGGSAETTPSSPPPPSTASPSSSASSTADAAADLQVKEAAHSILVGVQLWAVARYPAHYPAKATAALLRAHMLDPWPTNPFTGAAMKPGSGRGDYEYKVAADRKSCQVTVRLSDGSRFATQVMRINN